MRDRGIGCPHRQQDRCAVALQMPDVTNHDAKSARRAYLVGIVLVLVAAVLWSLNGVLIKLIHDGGRGPHGVTIAFYRSLFAGLFLVPLARGKFYTLRGERGAPNANPASEGPRGLPTTSGQVPPAARQSAVRRSLLAIRPAGIWCVVFFTLMTVCFVVANTKTEAANAIILQYTSTFWVFSLSPLILHERAHVRDVWILCLAFVGIAIIFVGNAGTDLSGLINALSAGLFYGLLTLMLRLLRNSDPAAVTVMNNLGSALLILPLALLMGDMIVSPRAWLLLVVLGVVQFGLPYYLFSLGLKRVPAYQAALITLVEPILVPVWTYLALSEKVPGTTMVGGGIILLALVVFVVTVRRRREPA